MMLKRLACGVALACGLLMIALGVASADDSDSVRLGISITDSSTATPTVPPATPTVTPTATPGGSTDGGKAITKLPATGGAGSADRVSAPAVLLLAGGALLVIGWKTRSRAV